MQLHEINPNLMDLFVDGTEAALQDFARLDVLGLGEASVLFMLQRQSWLWETCGTEITLSANGLVATKTQGDSPMLVTGGAPMTEGRHYWEVRATLGTHTYAHILVGAVRPGLDHNESHSGSSSDAYFLNVCGGLPGGGLHGSGKCNDDVQGNFELDVTTKDDDPDELGGGIGVLLDLDAGWLCFYRNGKRCGPGFTEGVTGPLVRAAEISFKINEGEAVAVVPGAVAPEGAGGADEPWEAPEFDEDGGLKNCQRW